MDSDGSVNVLYEVRDISEFDRGSGPPSIGSELRLLKIASDVKIQLVRHKSVRPITAYLFGGNIHPLRPRRHPCDVGNCTN